MDDPFGKFAANNTLHKKLFQKVKDEIDCGLSNQFIFGLVIDCEIHSVRINKEKAQKIQKIIIK